MCKEIFNHCKDGCNVFSILCHLCSLDNRKSIAHTVGHGIDDVNPEVILGFRVFLIEHISCKDCVLVCTGALGIDGYVNLIGITGFVGFFV